MGSWFLQMGRDRHSVRVRGFDGASAPATPPTETLPGQAFRPFANEEWQY
jgi:hypothetical protein